MAIVADTNVPVVANGNAPQASPACVRACLQVLKRVLTGADKLVLDDGWHIVGEYKANLRSVGQPGVGDQFLLWVLRNWTNPCFCELVRIMPLDDPRCFAEFPDDPALADFDPSDRKFVAVALAHPAHPPIANAVDSDWWRHQPALARHGVNIEFVCPDAVAGWH